MATTQQEHQQFQLARRVYRTLFEQTESFEEENRLGPDLAYLLGAILFSNTCGWPTDRPIVALLRQHFPPQDPLWQHIPLEPPEASDAPVPSGPPGPPAPASTLRALRGSE